MQDYLDFATQLAREAGAIMRTYFLRTEKEWKADNTPVTQADTEINSLVIERIEAAYPEHSIYGEEESRLKDHHMTWVCDPLDGTLPFSHGLPLATFSLALVENGEPIVGVVYDPHLDKMYAAAKGMGAKCNDEPIRVSSSGMDKAVIDLQAFPSDQGVVSTTHDIRHDFISRGTKYVQLWATIRSSTLVAEGFFAATILNISSVHDAAAVKIIVEEAGGKVTDIFGNEQRYDEPSRGFIASNGKVHQEIVDIIKEATK